MATNFEPYVGSASTTYVWRKVKLAQPRRAQSAAPQAPLRWRHRAVWNRRERLTLQVRGRGGAESWYEISARGSNGLFPGHLSLDDVMSEIYNER